MAKKDLGQVHFVNMTLLIFLFSSERKKGKEDFVGMLRPVDTGVKQTV